MTLYLTPPRPGASNTCSQLMRSHERVISHLKIGVDPGPILEAKNKLVKFWEYVNPVTVTGRFLLEFLSRLRQHGNKSLHPPYATTRLYRSIAAWFLASGKLKHFGQYYHSRARTTPQEADDLFDFFQVLDREFPSLVSPCSSRNSPRQTLIRVPAPKPTASLGFPSSITYYLPFAAAKMASSKENPSLEHRLWPAIYKTRISAYVADFLGERPSRRSLKRKGLYRVCILCAPVRRFLEDEKKQVSSVRVLSKDMRAHLHDKIDDVALGEDLQHVTKKPKRLVVVTKTFKLGDGHLKRWVGKVEQVREVMRGFDARLLEEVVGDVDVWGEVVTGGGEVVIPGGEGATERVAKRRRLY